MTTKCSCGEPVHDDYKEYRDYSENTAEYLFFRNCFNCAVEIAGNSDLGGVAVKCSKDNCPNYCEDVYVDIEDRENYPSYFDQFDDDDNPLCVSCFDEYIEEDSEIEGEDSDSDEDYVDSHDDSSEDFDSDENSSSSSESDDSKKKESDDSDEDQERSE
jgi:hypothetical protein